MIALFTVAFGIAWWLGLYLLARGPGNALLRRAGVGLLAYALALACTVLATVAPAGALANAFSRLYLLLVFVPALCWCGAAVLLLPETSRWRTRLNLLWWRGLLPLAALALLGSALSEPGVGLLYLMLSVIALAPLALVLALALHAWRTMRPVGLAALLAVATLFFGLGMALLLFPLGSVPPGAAALGVAVDLALLGVAVAWCHAFDEGETLRRDMLRSLLGAGCAALLFGGQVALAIWLGAQPALPLTALLLASIGAAIAAQALAQPLWRLLDQIAFPRNQALQQARAELHASAETLPRANDELELAQLEAAEFVRLTRRALSHYGDLPRLASSPLVRLPMVDAYLREHSLPNQPLERAAALRALLAGGIARLKPRDVGEFGTSDAWRHYNALYFPYVAGIKPYSRRVSHHELEPTTRRALEWFAAQVPERTLHNWQNAAARLVAHDLRASAGMPADANENAEELPQPTPSPASVR